MTTACYVIDTSYLLELFRVPGHSNDIAVGLVRKKYEAAIERGDRLFVPLPCIFELGNRIAHVGDGRRRKKLAKYLFETVQSSVDRAMPWT
ncbi:MAG: hypothetical protein KKB20_16325, partial [Proteobacteria bacterium]|nr:hypothetical protein [Pseudomonadota bacterium]